jgi:hypothetical protein
MAAPRVAVTTAHGGVRRRRDDAAELTFRRPGQWPSDGAFHRARTQWLQVHGIAASDWHAVHPIYRASKRAHAVVVAELNSLERSRQLSAGATLSDPA